MNPYTAIGLGQGLVQIPEGYMKGVQANIQLENMRKEQEMRDMQMEQNRMAMEEHRKAVADQEAINAAMAKRFNPITGEYDTQAMFTDVSARPSALPKIVSMMQEQSKKALERKKIEGELFKQNTERANSFRIDVANTAYSYSKNPNSNMSDMGNAFIAIAKRHGINPDEAALMLPKYNGEPGHEYAALVAASAMSPKERADLEAGERWQVDTGKEIKTYTRSKLSPGEAKEILVVPKVPTFGEDETKTQHKIQNNLEWAKVKLAKEAQAGMDLSPEALDMVSLRYLKDGTMPNLGMGKAGAAAKVKALNNASILAAREGISTDIASNKAKFGADQGSLNSMQKMYDAVISFEGTAKKNLDQFLDLASGMIDTGSPIINSPIRTINTKVLGKTEQLAVNAARQVAITEIAKITSNPSLTGQLTDSARHEVASFIPEDATLKQVVAVAKVLKRDMENRKTELEKTLEGIKERIASKPAISGVNSAGPKLDLERFYQLYKSTAR